MDKLTTDITERDYYTSEPIIRGRNYKTNGNCTMEEVVDKLGELENLEKQQGCPLKVREQAFNNGFYDADGKYYICEHYVPYLKSMHTRGIMRHTEKHFNLEDYKITWWLKEDRSE